MRYARKREQAAIRDKAASTAGRDIGLVHPETYNGRCACVECGGPRIHNKRRRNRCKKSLLKFCLEYRPEAFPLKFSKDHLMVIDKIEQAVLRGGLFAVAMPRGSGKTTIAESAALWAMLFGHRRFVVLIGSDQSASVELLQTIKVELESNDRLIEDFPHVCYPIRCLEGISHRCRGQLFNGKRTHVEWKSQELVLPSIAGDPAAGAVCKVLGITGRIRGLKHSRPDGLSLRPDLVIPDDPQTDDSAKSPLMTEQRIKTLNGAILGLSGPGRKIAGVMPCTVLRQGDMADRALDRKVSPDWQGDRTKLLYSWPDDMSLWDKYAELRAEGLELGAGTEAATEFYRKHRKKMDAGAKVAWDERFNEDEISAIQNAINLWLLDAEAFQAEYQNDPIDPQQAGQEELLSAEEIARKVSGYKRGVIPSDVEKVTAFVDIQAKVLYWAICGWAPNFSGWVIDYGTFPEQGVRYYTLSTLRRTLAQKYRGAHLTGRIRQGLVELMNDLGGREFTRDDGTGLRLDRLLIDFGWEPETDTVRKSIGEASFARAWPSKGVGVKAGDRPMGEWTRQKGDAIGEDWRMPKGSGKRRLRHVLFDSNAFKTKVQASLATAPGDPGCLQLFKDTAHAHRMIAEQLAAEYSVETEGRGRRIKEWKLRPGRDNHLLDCVVGCAVGASIEGCKLIGSTKPSQAKTQKRQRVSYLET